MSKDEDNKKPQNENSEEIVYEKDLESESRDVLDKIEKLKAELSKCKEEKQEYLDGWQRSKADFVNFKKRTEEDKKEFMSYATRDFIGEIIPVLDSFEQAFKHKESWEKAPPDWRKGIEFIYVQLTGILKNHNVTEVNPIDEKFDPKLHNSIENVLVEDDEKNGKIVEVIQKGYKIGDVFIRHPNVKVGEKKK